MFNVVRALIISTVLLLATAAHGQYQGYTPVDDPSQFKARFAQRAKTLQSIKSEFVQEKKLSLLEETIRSQGNFWFKRSDRVRIEYITPFKYLVIMNGDQLIVREGNSAGNRINTRSSKLFQQVNRIILDCVQGTILDNKNFSTRLFENQQSQLLEMTTIAPALKEFFTSIIVEVDKQDYSVNRIELHEPEGDLTTLSFHKKEINTVVDDTLFNR